MIRDVIQFAFTQIGRVGECALCQIHGLLRMLRIQCLFCQGKEGCFVFVSHLAFAAFPDMECIPAQEIQCLCILSVPIEQGDICKHQGIPVRKQVLV